MDARDKAKERAAVMLHWANGGEVEFCYNYKQTWQTALTPTWDWVCCDYRIKDPYAELKAAAKDPTKQIRCNGGGWYDAVKSDLGIWSWREPPETYEIRDKPKATKKVKILAWFTGAELVRFVESKPIPGVWKRVPSEDKEIEVEE